MVDEILTVSGNLGPLDLLRHGRDRKFYWVTLGAQSVAI